MPTREKLSVKVDYLSIIFDTVKADEVIQMLNVPPQLFHSMEGRVVMNLLILLGIALACSLNDYASFSGKTASISQGLT